jgi:hypothetical protein
MDGKSSPRTVELHPDKTRIVNETDDPNGFDFLGYTFKKGMRFVRKKSRMAMRDKISGKRRKKVTKECLMGAILDPINLQNAQDAVRRNKGCAGIDGRSIAETEQHWQQHLPEIEAKLRTSTYVPTPLKGMKIAKVGNTYGSRPYNPTGGATNLNGQIRQRVQSAQLRLSCRTQCAAGCANGSLLCSRR